MAIVEQGTGPPVVFLQSGVGSAREWRQVFALWPEGERLVAVDAWGAELTHPEQLTAALLTE